MAKLFFSYSHKDEDLRNELETHLSMLKHQGIISAWHDRRITAGREFDIEINSELEASDIILLLISANFLASEYCFNKEMKRALEKHEDGTAAVIPVILHPCDWQTSPFGKLRATPTDGKAVSMHANLHEAFAIITKDIREVANKFQKKEQNPATNQSYREVSATIDAKPRSSNLRIKRSFDDHERDEFLENSYEYIARFFDGSLEALQARNPQIKTRFKRLDETSFNAFVYENGKRVAQCFVYYGGSAFGSDSIIYSNSNDNQRNSYNDSLRVVDDGYMLQLEAMGMGMWGREQDKALSQQGAAEYYWNLFINHLQY
jgi:hypothetical protein